MQEHKLLTNRTQQQARHRPRAAIADARLPAPLSTSHSAPPSTPALRAGRRLHTSLGTKRKHALEFAFSHHTHPFLVQSGLREGFSPYCFLSYWLKEAKQPSTSAMTTHVGAVRDNGLPGCCMSCRLSSRPPHVTCLPHLGPLEFSRGEIRGRAEAVTGQAQPQMQPLGGLDITSLHGAEPG